MESQGFDSLHGRDPVRKNLEQHGEPAPWRRGAHQLLVACDGGGLVLRANLAARRTAKQLRLATPEGLLPATHPLLVTRCLAWGMPVYGTAAVGCHSFQWTYRRLSRREFVYLYGRCLDEHATELSRETTMLRQILGRFSFGVVVVDSELRIRYANPYAKALLERTWPGTLRDSRLFGLQGSLRQRLEPLVRRGEGVLVVHREAGKSSLELLVTRLVDSRCDVDSSASLTQICIVDPDYAPSSFPEHLKDLYGLTPAETRVAAALRTGARLQDGARELGVGDQTIRSHVRRVCQKLGAGRKAELLWRLNVCVGMLIGADWLKNFNDLP